MTMESSGAILLAPTETPDHSQEVDKDRSKTGSSGSGSKSPSKHTHFTGVNTVINYDTGSQHFFAMKGNQTVAKINSPALILEEMGDDDAFESEKGSPSANKKGSILHIDENENSTHDWSIGDRVIVANNSGVVVFIGQTKFAKGDWAGVVLDDKCGKHNGSVHGVQYFQCTDNHGLFARLSSLIRVNNYPLPRVRNCQDHTGYNRRNSNSSSTSRTRSTADEHHSSSGSTRGTPSGRGLLQDKMGSTNSVNSNGSSSKRKNPSSNLLPDFCNIYRSQYYPLNGHICPRFLRSLGQTSSKMSVPIKTPSLVYKGGTADDYAPAGIYNKSPNTNTLQGILHEKDQQIDLLLREHELERDEVAKVTAQVNISEQLYSSLRREYTEQRSGAKEQVDRLEDRIKGLEQNNRDLRNGLEDERKKTEDLLFQVEEGEIEKSTLEAQTVESESRCEELTRLLSEEKLRVERVSRQSQQQEDCLEREKMRTKEADQATRLHISQSEVATRRKTELENQLQRVQQFVQEDCYQDLLQTKEEQLESYKTRLKETEDRLKEATDRICKLESLLTDWPELKTHKTDVIEGLREQLSSLAVMRQTAEHRCHEAASELGNKESDLETFLAKGERLENTKKEMEKKMEQLSDCVEMSTQIDSLSTQLAELDKQHATTKEECIALREKVLYHQNQLDDRVFELDEKIENNDDHFTTIIKDYEDKVADMSNSLDLWRSRAEKMLPNHEAEIIALTDNQKKEITELNAQMKLQLVNEDQYSVDTKQNVSKLDEMRSTLEESHSEVQRLQTAMRKAMSERQEAAILKGVVAEEQDRVRESVRASEVFLSQIRNQLSKMTTEKEKAVHQMQKVKTSNHGLQVDLDSMQSQLAKVSSEKSRLEERTVVVDEELGHLRVFQDGTEEDWKQRQEVQRKVKHETVLQFLSSSDTVNHDILEAQTKSARVIGDKDILANEVSRLQSLLNEKISLQTERDQMQEALLEAHAKHDEMMNLQVDMHRMLSDEDENVVDAKSQLNKYIGNTSNVSEVQRNYVEKLVEQNQDLERRLLSVQQAIHKNTVIKSQKSIPSPTPTTEVKGFLPTISVKQDTPSSPMNDPDRRVAMLKREVARLESRYNRLTDLYERIQKDPRHASQILIASREDPADEPSESPTKKNVSTGQLNKWSSARQMRLLSNSSALSTEKLATSRPGGLSNTPRQLVSTIPSVPQVGRPAGATGTVTRSMGQLATTPTEGRTFRATLHSASNAPARGPATVQRGATVVRSASTRVQPSSRTGTISQSATPLSGSSQGISRTTTGTPRAATSTAKPAVKTTGVYQIGAKPGTGRIGGSQTISRPGTGRAVGSTGEVNATGRQTTIRTVVTSPSTGRGTVPSTGRGTVPSTGRGTVPSTGRGTVPSTGRGTVPSTGRGTVASTGRGTVPSTGRGTVPSTGRGTVPSTGRGTVPSTGRGTVPSTGRGTVPSTGRGTVPSTGRGTVPSTGRGTVPSTGRGTVQSTGRGTVPSTGRGTVPSTGRGTVPSTGRGITRGVTATRPGVRPTTSPLQPSRSTTHIVRSNSIKTAGPAAGTPRLNPTSASATNLSTTRGVPRTNSQTLNNPTTPSANSTRTGIRRGPAAASSTSNIHTRPAQRTLNSQAPETVVSATCLTSTGKQPTSTQNRPSSSLSQRSVTTPRTRPASSGSAGSLSRPSPQVRKAPSATLTGSRPASKAKPSTGFNSTLSGRSKPSQKATSSNPFFCENCKLFGHSAKDCMSDY